MKFIAYNALTMEQLEFKTKKAVYKFFGIDQKSLNKYLESGVPCLELADENNKSRIDEVVQKMKGFEIFTKEEFYG